MGEKNNEITWIDLQEKRDPAHIFYSSEEKTSVLPVYDEAQD